MDQPSNVLFRPEGVRRLEQWRPFLVKGEQWQAGLDAIAREPVDVYGRRELLIRHPDSEPSIGGLAPGIEVRFGTLAPGQATLPCRTNASEFFLLIDGAMELDSDGGNYALGKRDAWVIPAMRSHALRNSGSATARYVCYSNAAMLKYMRVFFEQAYPSTQRMAAAGLNGFIRARDIAGPGHQLNETGARILPYEYLVDPDSVESRVLVWRWGELLPHLPSVLNLHPDYDGRTLWVLYNPATERRVGTTPSFFASMACAKPRSSTASHRHASAAINFILEGTGHSLVDGERMDWTAGDIMLSAPGWLAHSHHFHDDVCVVLTVQDHPLHIATESLIWQEQLPAGPIVNLGTQTGFSTNLASLVGADKKA